MNHATRTSKMAILSLLASAIFCAGPSRAALIVETFNFDATFASGPHSEITGSFTLTYDPTIMVFSDSSAGLVLNDISAPLLNIPVGYFNTPVYPAISFSQVGIGGLLNRINQIDPHTNDFFFSTYSNPVGQPSIFGYAEGGNFLGSQSSSEHDNLFADAPSVYFASRVTVTASSVPAQVPESEPIGLLGIGTVAAIVVRRSTRRRSSP